MGDQASSYHLEAGIAASHAAAPSYESTDWQQILELYEHLLVVNPSPVVALNRAVALSRCSGPLAAILALDSVRHHPALKRYYLLWAIMATLHTQLGDVEQARTCYHQALGCPCSTPERRFLEGKLAALDHGSTRP